MFWSLFSHVHGIDHTDSRFNRKYRHLCRPYSPQPVLGDIVICPVHLLNSRDCRFSSRNVAIYFTFFRYAWKWIKTLCHLCQQHRLESLERETVECGKVELPVSNTSELQNKTNVISYDLVVGARYSHMITLFSLGIPISDECQ